MSDPATAPPAICLDMIEGIDRDLIAELGKRSADAGLRAASLDGVFCVTELPSEAVTPSP